MPTTTFEHNQFQKNLEESIQIIKGRRYTDYCLKKNGEIVRKTSWLGRLIRWLLDKFFDKTIRDIWQVFKQTRKDFNESFEWCRKLKEGQRFRVLEETSARCRRLRFALKFLYSRKKSLDRWIKKNPRIAQSLKRTINKYRAVSLNNVELDKLVTSLEKVYFPSVNQKALSKKPPSFKLSVSPETNKRCYHSLNLNCICKYYQEIPLSQKLQDLAHHLVRRFNSGTFLEEFTEVCQNERIPKEKLPEQLMPDTSLILEEPFTIQSLTRLWESMLECIATMVPHIDDFIEERQKLEIAGEVMKQALSTLTCESEGRLDFFLLKELYEGGANLSKMIDSVVRRDKTVFGVNATIYNEYYDQIECFLKNILFEIEHQPDTSVEKSVEVLRELAIATGECSARWIEESKRQYRKLKIMDASNLEVNVLEHLQSLKEDLILELFQDQELRNEIFQDQDSIEFHILNTFRKEFGDELGLDNGTLRFDMFIRDVYKGKEMLKKLFLEHYTPVRIVKGVTERINFQLHDRYEPMYFSFLNERLTERHPEMEDPSSYVMSTFMGKNYRSITEDGVLFLLTEMGFLTR